jgi:hypothetical protein
MVTVSGHAVDLSRSHANQLLHKRLRHEMIFS